MKKGLLAFCLCLLATPALAAGKTFIFHNAIRDLGEFRAYAGTAARLKRYGTVQIDIGVLAEKSPVHMPGVRSPWHDYGAYMATMWAFFPHPKLAPYVPAEWVARNRQLLLGKVAILRELGLEAVFSANETQFLPEPFFRKYPELRGPRVDHPLRSGKAEFAWCVDQPQTLEMIEWMMAELKRHAPQIQAMHSWNNDSGSGICWLTALYPGPNGPASCRYRDAGLRVRGLMEAMDRGARSGGGPVHIRLAGNFPSQDRERIEPQLPSCARFSSGDKSIITVGTRAGEAYPVRGLIDVLAALESLEKLPNPEVQTVDIDTCQPWYFRTNEPIPTVRRLVDIVEDSIKSPVRDAGSPARKASILAARWGGEKNADRVMEAFRLTRQSFGIFARSFFRDVVLSSGYAYTATNRLITRPLLIKPEFLTRDQESYFLPYIFSTDEDDARLDYNTAHGHRRTSPAEYRSPAYKTVHDSARDAAGLLEQAADAPERAWLRQLALSLRLWASTVRSHDNFYFAQVIRDRRKDDLAAAPRFLLARKDEPDLLLWNEIQRDELDNTVELRALLEAGGLELLARARNPRDEDVFLYGPDIYGALHKKMDLMRAHWLDGQRYLSPARK
ncbi:MAG: hypothetical protein NTY38_14570 [Acidobacteria bacterium]|nr:hypothetical protein [Acidobacteriota bacterium]